MKTDPNLDPFGKHNRRGLRANGLLSELTNDTELFSDTI